MSILTYLFLIYTHLKIHIRLFIYSDNTDDHNVAQAEDSTEGKQASSSVHCTATLSNLLRRILPSLLSFTRSLKTAIANQRPKMNLNNMEGGHDPRKAMPYTDNPKRPLSASRRVYPAPLDINMPTKAMPLYIPQQQPTTKAAAQYMPDPNSADDPNKPPAYGDEKRARLLENAAREARDRRAKEEAEGRPISSPFAAAPKRENSKGDSPRDQPSPAESTASTSKLLGKNGGKKGGGDEQVPLVRRPSMRY